MPDGSVIAVTAAGAVLLLLGVLAQVRAHRMRRRWRRSGMGIEERATGLASIAAVPVLFPGELATAAAAGMRVAVLVLRRYTVHPEQFGRELARVTRAHEIGWRVDYDLFAVTLMVQDQEEAVLAAARIGGESCAGDARDLRLGIAMCPDDATDFLDAVDIAQRRMRGWSLVEAVARARRDDAAGDENVAGRSVASR